MALAVAAEAKPRDGGRWLEKRVDPIVKILKKMIAFTSLRDGTGRSVPMTAYVQFSAPPTMGA